MIPTATLAHAARPDASPWVWHLHPDVIIVMLSLAAGFVAAFRLLGPRLAGNDMPVAKRRQVILIVVGVALLWVASDWPVHDLAEGPSYTVHMVQHAVYTLIVPPLLILGTPAWLWRWLFQPVMPAVRLVTRPVVAILIFSAVSLSTHLPVFVTAALRSGPAHFGQHLALVLAAFVVWWPMASPVPELPRLSVPIHQMTYLFFMSLVPSIAGSFIVWAQQPPYKAYEQFHRVFGLGTLEDQQLGGVVMSAVEGTVVFGLMLVIALRVNAREMRDAEARRLRPADLHPSVGVDPA